MDTLARRIERLPKWARRYIEGLERRIDGPSIEPGAVNFISLTCREREMQRIVAESEPRREAARCLRGRRS